VTDYFLDASALIKRYLVEPGTQWTVSLTNSAANHSILLAEITLAEIAAGVSAKQRAPQGISLAARNGILALFIQECGTEFTLVPANRRVIDLAVTLTQGYRLRGYDAVQLAAGLVANDDLTASGHAPLTFVTADNDLLLAAQGERLPTENPLDYTHLDPSP
jgi:uncharacterized protein